MQQTSKQVCSRIEELTNTIILNERILDEMYIGYKEQEGMEPTVDFATVGQLELDNRLMREELNKLCSK